MSAPPLTSWDRVPLGRMRDADIARRLGCPTNTVVVARLHRGIAAPGRIGLVCLADWPCPWRARNPRAIVVNHIGELSDPFAMAASHQRDGHQFCPGCGGRLA